MGSPVTVETAEGEEVRFALQDRSREAPHSWAPDVSEYFQGGPDRARRAYIGPRAVRQLRTAPDPDAPARRAAYDEDRARARASRTLGALGGKGAETHAGTHAKRARLGRTAGKAPEAYASRETRLGPDVRR